MLKGIVRLVLNEIEYNYSEHYTKMANEYYNILDRIRETIRDAKNWQDGVSLSDIPKQVDEIVDDLFKYRHENLKLKEQNEDLLRKIDHMHFVYEKFMAVDKKISGTGVNNG